MIDQLLTCSPFQQISLMHMAVFLYTKEILIFSSGQMR